MEILRRDDTNHQYYLGEKQLISVTQAIDQAKQTDYPLELKDIDMYLTRGTAVDIAISLYLMGKKIDWGKDIEVIRPYFDGFLKFEKETGFKYFFTKHLVVSKSRWFAGELDMTGEIFGNYSLIDIKASPNMLRHYRMQTAAYKFAHNEMYPAMPVVDRYVLLLPGDGSYKLVKCNRQNDINAFFACLILAQFNND